ncbi:hypothetical protein D0T84_20705 [Dysgonomonas sp. 521]|uniref:YbbC/YhhH family protein n=1 Tax=Dysgonomonas sp. 521 TaxID=2302932 RepID=UPI0013D1A3BF|nr:YbbC/YhhH family protein [Dysgonomonas sp. 521]NDV97301.1 hypothetical protein [Dysgonomonas sp. 521]
MKKKITSFLVVIFITLNLHPQKSEEIIKDDLSMEATLNDNETRDYVPNEETAKKIAEAIWIPIFGETHILEQRPYKVKLINDVWIVEGLIPEPYRYDPNVRGGGAYIEIRKKDCKILKVMHYR